MVLLRRKYIEIFRSEINFQYSMKTWRSKSFIRSKRLGPYIIYLFKMVSEGSYDYIVTFWCVSVLQVMQLCRER